MDNKQYLSDYKKKLSIYKQKIKLVSDNNFFRSTSLRSAPL